MGWIMKSQSVFWTATLLLVALGISGCLVEATQQEGPTAQQTRNHNNKKQADKGVLKQMTVACLDGRSA
jgi:hypothetical protein